MQNAIKKVYISMLVVVLCAVAFTATTFAWVGIFTSASLERFQINLSEQELEEYGLEISLTGEEGTFSSTIDQTELRKQLLINMGYNGSYISNENAINNAFRNITLAQCTVNPKSAVGFKQFLTADNKLTTKYFKFNLFISSSTTDNADMSADFCPDIYLSGNLFDGTLDEVNLVNEYTYPSTFVNNVVNGIKPNTTISNRVKVNSSSASRLAIQKYNVVEKGHPELYESYSNVIDYIIYQGGTEKPTCDSNGIYSFGGIMEDQYNLALYDWNMKHDLDIKRVPTWAINRGDVEFNDSTNKIVDSTIEAERIRLGQMMKLTIYFWFEGWDADCFNVIDRNPVTINLNFKA